MDFHSRQLTKADGRSLWLYGRRPIDPTLTAPSPPGAAVTPNPHLRWHPLRGEWVSYADHRQARTFLPPPEYNPLAPAAPSGFPTEQPPGD
jgi:UDPglucose--hexose-1-phosphate uridylyltransferase